MPVIEHNLSSNKKLVSAHRISHSEGRSDAQQRVYWKHTFKRVPVKDICLLARQLATLLHAGMPLVPALSALVEQLQQTAETGLMPWGPRNSPLAEVMEQVTNRVNAGSTLASALEKHPNVFSSLFVNMVAAGQASGNLEGVLCHLAEMLEKRVNLTGKVKAAIAYPLMMILVAAGVVLFLLSFVVPSITRIFLEMNRILPWPTRMLIITSTFIKTYLLPIIIVVCVAVFGIGFWMRTREARLFVDRSKLKLPVFGNLLLKLEIARLTRTLGILLLSGIPILGALEIAKGIVQNSFIAGGLDSIRNLVSRGDNIAAAIRKTRLFPPIVFHIIATGQTSGNIETDLLDIANMYDDEVARTAKMLTALLEPLILLVMGVIIGFIVMAVLLPIFEISQGI
jgi:general secretion pathway protein F